MKIQKSSSLKVAIVISLILATNNSVYAHSGRTDANGGHNCSQSSIDKGLCTGYHYHNDGDGSSNGSGNTIAIVGVVVAGLLLWYFLTNDEKESNSIMLKSNSFSKVYGSTVEQGTYISVPLSMNNKFNYQMGINSITQEQYSNNMLHKRNQFFAGIGYNFSDRINVNLWKSPDQTSFKFGLKF